MSNTHGEPFFGFRGEDIVATAGALVKEAAEHPTLLLEENAELIRDVTRVLSGQSDIKPALQDKRFGDVAWADNPFYRVFLGGYLSWSKTLTEYIDKTSFDERTKGRARFAAELITSALAPSNSLANPAALKRILDTGGGSVVHGLRNMMSDLFTNGGMPTQVDKSAFEVGRNIATTEGSVVFRNDVLELIQYKPLTETVYSVPFLFVPPQINRFYIFDLSPQNSVFRFLLEGGLQIFTISWRNPTPAQRDWGIDTYVSSILECVAAVQEICNAEKINIAGACAGGLTLSALLGWYAAGSDACPLNSATHLVSVLGLGMHSPISLLITEDVIKAAKAASALRGVLDGADMGRIFAWLRPDDLVWNYWVNNYLMGKDPPAFDLLYWNADTTRLTATFHAELLDSYWEKRFLTAGAMTVLGRPIDLAKISLDEYFIAGITDHIAEWKSVYENMMSYGGDRTMVLSAAGHIQSMVNPPALAAKRQYLLNPDHPQDPAAWLAGATSYKGSWWNHWLEWLQQRSGRKVDASQELGSLQHPPLCAAPGEYVHER
ncbi:MAG: alpha/beta fold hydrolase [Vulcanimicrobiaceae bacterium]